MLKKFWRKISRPQQEEGLHIQILRYALANPGFTPKMIRNDLNLNHSETAFLLSQLHKGEFFQNNGMSDECTGDSRGASYMTKYMLSFEGRSRLLEYDELKEARENAHKAHVYAMFALIVSAIGVMVQIFC
jgi:hypothetical protein